MKLTLEEAMRLHKKLYETIRDMQDYGKYSGMYFNHVCQKVAGNLVGEGKWNFTCFLCEYAYEKNEGGECKLDRCKHCPVFDEYNTCEEYKPYCTVRNIFSRHASIASELVCAPFSMAEIITIKECCDKISRLKPRRDCK